MTGTRTLTSNTVVMRRNDVDTDQIIPARFLTTTSRDGLGAGLFAEWRYLPSGEPNPDFELNRPENAGAEILVAGRNFGCGSSREHAPWALLDFGIKAVLSSEIADIFRSNALKNGLLAIVVPEPFHQHLLAIQRRLRIDLDAMRIDELDGTDVVASTTFELDPFARFCIMRGTDQLGFLLDQDAAIREFEQRRADQDSR